MKQKKQGRDRYLNMDEKRGIYRMFKAGERTAEICRKYNTYPATVKKAIKDVQEVEKKRKKSLADKTQDRNEELVDRLLSDISDQAIGEASLAVRMQAATMVAKHTPQGKANLQNIGSIVVLPAQLSSEEWQKRAKVLIKDQSVQVTKEMLEGCQIRRPDSGNGGMIPLDNEIPEPKSDPLN